MVNVAFELGNQTQEELEYSKNIDLIQYDFFDTLNLCSFVKECKKKHHVEILINNAAFYQYDKSPTNIKIKTIEKYLNINLITPYILSNEFSKDMFSFIYYVKKN